MKLLSLNVEGRKHWDRVNPFVEAERPDVVCMQEIFESDALNFAERFSLQVDFEPMLLDRTDRSDLGLPLEKKGVAIFSRSPMKNARSITYHSDVDELVVLDKSNAESLRKTQRNLLAIADIEVDGAVYTVATTHFPRTPDGAMSVYQEMDSTALLKILADVPEVIITGDFNAPRGFNEVYDLFAAKYEDAIPKSYATSLDPEFHRAYQKPDQAPRVSKFMVDYLLLSPKYVAGDVRLQFGLSDHAAIVASVVPRIINS